MDRAELVCPFSILAIGSKRRLAVLCRTSPSSRRSTRPNTDSARSIRDLPLREGSSPACLWNSHPVSAPPCPLDSSAVGNRAGSEQDRAATGTTVPRQSPEQGRKNCRRRRKQTTGCSARGCGMACKPQVRARRSGVESRAWKGEERDRTR